MQNEKMFAAKSDTRFGGSSFLYGHEIVSVVNTLTIEEGFSPLLSVWYIPIGKQEIAYTCVAELIHFSNNCTTYNYID